MDAEELAHDSFIKALKSLSKFKSNSSFSTWLYRIAFNTCLSKLKKKIIDTTDIDEVNESAVEDENLNPFELLAGTDRLMYLNRALNELNEDENLLIDLYYRHEIDMHEIGDIVGLSHNNVRVKLMRIRKKIYVYLKNELKSELPNLQ